MIGSLPWDQELSDRCGRAHLSERASTVLRITMARRAVHSAILTGVFCATVAIPRVHAESPLTVGTKVGQLHPGFLLPKTDGGMGRLSDYRGRKVLLIHFASW